MKVLFGACLITVSLFAFESKHLFDFEKKLFELEFYDFQDKVGYCERIQGWQDRSVWRDYIFIKNKDIYIVRDTEIECDSLGIRVNAVRKFDKEEACLQFLKAKVAFANQAFQSIHLYEETDLLFDSLRDS